MNSSTKVVSVSLDSEILRLLDSLAESDRRNRSNFVAVLVEQEAERRGVVLPPEQAVEKEHAA